MGVPPHLDLARYPYPPVQGSMGYLPIQGWGTPLGVNKLTNWKYNLPSCTTYAVGNYRVEDTKWRSGTKACDYAVVLKKNWTTTVDAITEWNKSARGLWHICSCQHLNDESQGLMAHLFFATSEWWSSQELVWMTFITKSNFVIDCKCTMWLFLGWQDVVQNEIWKWHWWFRSPQWNAGRISLLPFPLQ